MPEIIHYLVTQTRQVQVDAEDAEDAVRIAKAAFTHGQNSDCGVAKDKGPEGIWGNTTSRILETEIYVSRKTP